MRSRAFSPIAAILSVVVLTSGTAYGNPIVFRQITQVVSAYQSSADLRLRTVSQSTNGAVSDQKRSAANNSDESNPNDSLLAGISNSNDPKGSVEVVAEGEFEGAICDCGEIAVAGGFPKWPLLFLAAVPLVFIHSCDTCNDSTPTPSPTPPTTPTPRPPEAPEPASLFLLGSGLTALGARLRKRCAQCKKGAQQSQEGTNG